MLPESAPVTMRTPGLYPKLTMWWSSFCSSGWFQTQNPPASASGVLRLQVHTIMETVSLLSISDLGAYPLAPLPYTIVLRTVPQACEYGHSKCVFFEGPTTLGLGSVRRKIPSMPVSYLWFQALPGLTAREEPLGMITLKSFNHERRNSQALWCKINFKPGFQATSELFLGWTWSKC